MLSGPAEASARVFVVVPARDEELLIQTTLRGIPSWVERIVVVDDGSRDQTAARVRQLAEPRVVLLHHDEAGGVGRAIATGYRLAWGAGADVAVVMAGDNQMDPSDLEALVAPVASGTADYVKGNRFVHAERRRMPWMRRLAGRVLAFFTRLASGLSIDDSQCGYTAIGRAALGAVLASEPWPGYGYPNDLLVLLGRSGYRVLERPVRPVYAGERSGVRFWHALVVLAVIVRRLLARRRPFEQGAALPQVQRAVQRSGQAS